MCVCVSTHSDLVVGPPVGRGHLVREPGGHSLSGPRAVLGHGLDHIVDPVQDPLGRVLVVHQEGLALGPGTERTGERRRKELGYGGEEERK